jgi:hypothetical protein
MSEYHTKRYPYRKTILLTEEQYNKVKKDMQNIIRNLIDTI